MSPKYNFSKEIFRYYIHTECERMLFLNLSKAYPDVWIRPLREIIKKKRIRFEEILLTKEGKKYEQKVYERILELDNVFFKKNRRNEVADTTLDVSLLRDIYSKIKKKEFTDVILLEHKYINPESFFNDLFDISQKNDSLPIIYSNQIPDIMIISDLDYKKKNDLYEVLPTKEIRKLKAEDIEKRVGISVFDIKKTRERNVGKKQFVEILYYLYTLSYYIKENHLEEYFYVRADFGGIFYEHEDEKLNGLLSISDFFNFCIKINQIDFHRILYPTLEKIKAIHSKSPCSIQSIPTKIQPYCGYCNYYEDCLSTLGVIDGTDRKDWSIKVLPVTSQSIIQELIDEENVHTLGDLEIKLKTIIPSSIPKPLYYELPLLKTKTKALIEKKVTFPDPEKIHTYSLPRYSPIALTYVLETDLANDIAYAISFFLNISIFTQSSIFKKFKTWIYSWKKYRDGLETIEIVKKRLDRILETSIPEADIKKMQALVITLKNLDIEEKTGKGIFVSYKYSLLNEYISKESESFFFTETISQLYFILEFCNLVEKYVFVRNYDGKGGDWVVRPDLSIFYWSEKEKESFDKMVERNFYLFIKKPDLFYMYTTIQSYFTPAEKGVKNPYQSKKFYDIQKFTETVIGVPNLVNYTWHSVSNALFNLIINQKYWVKHFNYMDFEQWYKYLTEENPLTKQLLKAEILRQLNFKSKMINDIRYYFQKKSKNQISKHSYAQSTETFESPFKGLNLHPIAKTWYLFAKQTGFFNITEKERIRTVYPLYSIGKLEAAQVSNLSCKSSDKKVVYKFNLLGLSTNIKLKAGDLVFLLPDYKRDSRFGDNIFRSPFSIKISKIRWKNAINGYEIYSKAKYKGRSGDLLERCIKEKKQDFNKVEWFLYPTAMDYWSDRLKALLSRFNIGKSWLGYRLAYIWGITSNLKLKWPESWKFNSQEIYLYLPEIICNLNQSSSQKLLTTIYPPPDISQVEAINNSIGNIFSAILGPPGTGKTATIAALLEELYIKRKNQSLPTRVLITTFSYAALHVILNKIIESKNIDGSPTSIAKMHKIFIRSQGQTSLENEEFRVDEVYKNESGTWTFNGETNKVTKKSNRLVNLLDEGFIIFSLGQQLYTLYSLMNEITFDLICVDEASQLQVDLFIPSLQYINQHDFIIKPPLTIKECDILTLEKELKPLIRNSLTKIVIVGDNNQLPPVQTVKPPIELKAVLDNLYTYYVDHHNITQKQLRINYRSHEDIVNCTMFLGSDYEKLTAYKENAKRLLEGNIDNITKEWVKTIMDPNKVVCSVIHNQKYEIGVSRIEGAVVKELIMGYYQMRSPMNASEEELFWKKCVGVVAPHNAQGRLIIRMVHNYLTQNHLTNLDSEQLMELLTLSVVSVEKFQGSERDCIISTIGISDKEQLEKESEFIYNIERFNVLTSRAKSKIVLVCSSAFLEYPPKDRESMESSSKIYKYAYQYCNKEEILSLKSRDKEIKINLRYKKPQIIK